MSNSKKSIYPQRSQQVNTIFNENGDYRKILVVPIDFAKDEHEAQICRATGEFLLKRPLRIYNNLSGQDFLSNKINSVCRKYAINKQHVILCGEDPSSFAVNFIFGMRQRGFEFVRANAKEASKLRTSTRASTNALDLNGIAQAVIHRRAYSTEDYGDLYSCLKTCVRGYVPMVKQQTALKNRIHQNVDILFPGFLSKKITGLPSFSNASIHLMSSHFSLSRIKGMSRKKLISTLKKHRVHNAEEVMQSIKALAGTAPPPPAPLNMVLSRALEGQIALLKQYEKAKAETEKIMACLLAQTPCFILFTYPGVNLITTAKIVSELGDPEHWPSAMNICSYAGITTRIKQTGSPDSEPLVLSLPRDCNRLLKNALLNIPCSAERYPHDICRVMPGHNGDHPLRLHYRRKEAEGRRFIISTAQKFVRSMCRVVRQQIPYLAQIQESYSSMEEANTSIALQMEAAVYSLRKKWDKYDLSEVPDDKNLMKQWIDKCIDDYALDHLRK